MQRIFFITLLFFTCHARLFSQDGLAVKFGSKGLFLEHTVGAKENFYSIGRLYHVHPKNLAGYNNLDMAKGLSVGQSLNIPLTDTNLNRRSGEGIPVFYQPLIKQTAGSISALSKTPLDNIRKWNNLASDNIGAGSKIIIGYMIPSADMKTANISGVRNTDGVKAVTGKKSSTAEEKKDTVAVAKKEQPKPAEALPAVVAKEEPAKAKQQEQAVVDEEGYFKGYFSRQIKNIPLSKDETVTSGIFKTASGWDDGKYYALIDGVEPGMVIRVINPSNNKTVYAKVLGQISGIRQNQGLNLRISNAAATALAILEQDKFIVKLNY